MILELHKTRENYHHMNTQSNKRFYEIISEQK